MTHESSATPNFDVVEPDDLKEPKFVNTFRMSFSEGTFYIDFGRALPVETDKSRIDVVSKLILPDGQMEHLILSLVVTALKYEMQFGKKILHGPAKDEAACGLESGEEQV